MYRIPHALDIESKLFRHIISYQSFDIHLCVIQSSQVQRETATGFRKINFFLQIVGRESQQKKKMDDEVGKIEDKNN